jgi:hypothetical protein
VLLLLLSSQRQTQDFSAAHVRVPGEGELIQKFALDAPALLSLIARRVKVFELTKTGHVSHNLNLKTSLC